MSKPEVQFLKDRKGSVSSHIPDTKINAKERQRAAEAMGRTSKWDDRVFTIGKNELADIRASLREVQMKGGAGQLRAMRLETMIDEYEAAVDYRADVHGAVDQVVALNEAMGTCLESVPDELRVSEEKLKDVLQDHPDATKEELLALFTDQVDEEISRIKGEVKGHLEVMSKAVEDAVERVKGLTDVDDE